ncbi:Kelch repeat-containing protein [Sunxiuqinia elliptica]
MNKTLAHIKSRTQVFLYCLSLFAITLSCKKEQIILTSPSIEIVSAKQIALTTFEVVVQIDIGEDQDIKKAEVILDDITVLSVPDIINDIKLNEKQTQTNTITVNTMHLSHDYNIQASLETNLFTYKSETKIIRSLKNSFLIDVYPSGNYSELNNNITDFINIGDHFSLKVDYLNSDFKPNSVEVKLDRKIALEHNLDFKNHWFEKNVTTMGQATIPKDIKPGIYEVYVYIDGFEIKTRNKIKVLKGRWEKVNTSYPGQVLGQYSSFIKDDKLYLFGGEGYTVPQAELRVYEYEIIGNSWTRKRDFKKTLDPLNQEILSFDLTYNGKAYILFRNDKAIEIWRYENEKDEWSLITNYPGNGNQYMTTFITNGKMFIGGGGKYLQSYVDYTPYYDFWVYDLETGKWNQKNDIPIKLIPEKMNSARAGTLSQVIDQNNVFVFSFSNDLWLYNPELDSWSKKKNFPGHIRMTSNFIEKDNNLYLIAGSYLNYGYCALKDCWEYSVASDSWEMVAYLPELYANGISFTHNNFIYVGLGWVINGYYTYYDQNLYKLNI